MDKGFYTIALAFPVIPYNTARIRIIVTAIHTHAQIDGIVQAFKEIGDEINFFETIMKDTVFTGHADSNTMNRESQAFKAKL
jgi:hypothetical protein